MARGVQASEWNVRGLWLILARELPLLLRRRYRRPARVSAPREQNPDELRRAGLILLPVSAVLAVVDHHTVPVVRALWAVALSGLTLGLSAAPVRSLVNPVTQRLGQASFNPYLIHPLVVGILDRAGVIDRLYVTFGSVVGYLIAC